MYGTPKYCYLLTGLQNYLSAEMVTLFPDSIYSDRLRKGKIATPTVMSVTHEDDTFYILVETYKIKFFGNVYCACHF